MRFTVLFLLLPLCLACNPPLLDDPSVEADADSSDTGDAPGSRAGSSDGADPLHDASTTPAPDGSDLPPPDLGGDLAPAQPAAPVLGGACAAAADCESGYCVEGVCCDRACNDTAACEHCAAARGAETSGVCEGAAELPRAVADFNLSAPPKGLTPRVLAPGEDLQRVLDTSGPGVEIIVPADRRFGPITLPARAPGNTRWTVIRSGAAGLPPAGTRVSRGDAARMPKILAPAGGVGVRTAPGASRYWITGFEVTTESAGQPAYALALLGDPVATQVTADRIVLDRVWLHGDSAWTAEIRAGVVAAGTAIALIDSRVTDIHTLYKANECTGGCKEAYGFVSWNGPGPYVIAGNYIAAGSHDVFFGGTDSSSEAMMPADITVADNHLHKPLSWYRAFAEPRWQTKTIVELKTGARVLIEGNRFENEWNSAGNAAKPQIGHALVISPRNGDDTHRSPWSGVRDLTVRHNAFTNASRGISLVAEDDRAGAPTRGTRCVVVDDNLFDRLPGTMPGDGRWVTMLSGPNQGLTNVRLSHNTAMAGAALVLAASFTGAVPNSGFVFRDNLAVAQRGLVGDGRAEGTDALSSYLPGAEVRRNDLVGIDGSVYGACTDRAQAGCTFFSAATAAVSFTNMAAGDYRLAAASPDRGACSHAFAGRPHDIGVRDFGPTGVGRAAAARDREPEP